MIRRLLLSAALLLCLVAPASAVPICNISGQILDPLGNPIPNATIQLNSLVTQIISGATIPPTYVSATSDATGTLGALAIAQGLQIQVIVCNPKASGCGAPTFALIPLTATAHLSDILSGILLTGAPGTVSSLTVTGNTTMGGTLAVTGGTTMSTLGLGTAAAPTSPILLALKTNFSGPNGTSMVIGDTNTAAASNYYVNDDIASTTPGTGHFGAMTMYNTAWVPDIGEDQPDTFRILTNATGGLNIDSNVSQMRFWQNGGFIAQFRPGGEDIGSQSVGSDPLDITDNTNGGADVFLNNPNAGSGAQAGMIAENGSYLMSMAELGTAFGATGPYVANQGVLQTGGPGGMLIYAYSASGAVKLAANGNGGNGTLNLSEDGSGNFFFAPSAGPLFSITNNKHLGATLGSGSALTAASCGSGTCTFLTGSTDTAGVVQIGGGSANSIIINLGSAFHAGNATGCSCSNSATWCSPLVNVAGTQLQLTFGATNSGFSSWVCIDH